MVLVSAAGALLVRLLNLPDRVTREAYSHEVSSCGFWPGGGPIEYAAFYSYAYPGPDGDFWVSEGGGTYVLRRERVTGDTVLIVERDFEPVAVSAEARRDAEIRVRDRLT